MTMLSGRYSKYLTVFSVAVTISITGKKHKSFHQLMSFIRSLFVEKCLLSQTKY